MLHRLIVRKGAIGDAIAVQLLLKCEVQPIPAEKVDTPGLIVQNNVEAVLPSGRARPYPKKRVLWVGAGVRVVPDAVIDPNKWPTVALTPHHHEVTHHVRIVTVAVENDKHGPIGVKKGRGGKVLGITGVVNAHINW